MAAQLPSAAGLPSSKGQVGPAAGRYSALSAQRENYLVRARRLAGLTIPSLFRDKGADGSTDEPTTWQSLGARGVNNLAAKIVLALFPPGRAFVRFKPDRKVVISLNQLDPDTRGALAAETDKGLSKVEREFSDCFEEDGDRAVMFDTARHLIVGGNHCLKAYDDGSVRGIPLESYTTLRDGTGQVIEAVICDAMAYQALPSDVRDMITIAGYDTNPKTNPKAEVEVYTHILLDDESTYSVYQECFGLEVPGSHGSFTKEYLPYLFLTMIRLKAEHYGRSYAEDYEGDLTTVDSLTEIITTGSAAVARFIQLVRPGGMVSKKALAGAPNGAVLTGQAEDVVTVSSNKAADFNVAQTTKDGVEKRIEAAFLLNSTVQRNAERVTAEEIRFVAQELEAALGGVYANQVVTWQRPFAVIKLKILQRKNRVTSFPNNSVKVTVIAGMAAIGRNDELAALDSFMQGGIASLGAEVITQSINPRIYLSRRAAALSIDTDGLVYSEQEADANSQAKQQQQMMALFGPEAVKQIGQYITRSNAAAITANASTQGTPAIQPGQAAPPTPGAGSAPGSGLTPFTPSQAPNFAPQAAPAQPVS